MVGFTPPPSSPNPPSPLTQALLQWMALMAQNAAPNAGGSPPSMASMAPMPDGMNGMMRGPGTGTSDSILARVSNGEYVLPKATVDQVGPQNLDALRQATQPPPPQTVPRFAEGGMTPYGNDSSITDQYQRASAIYNGPPATQTATTPASPTVAPSALPTPSAYATARSGADALDVASGRFDRNYTAPPTAPTALSQNGLSGLLGALGQPQQQQQNAYTTARGSADPLDVASGRFDRNYSVPRFAGGGYIDPGFDPTTFSVRGAAMDDYGNMIPRNLTRPVDSLGNQYVGGGAGSRPAMGNPANPNLVQNPRGLPNPPSWEGNAPLVPGGGGQPAATGLARFAPMAGRVLGGVGMMLYPSPLGAGTLDSPEAQRQMALNRESQPPVTPASVAPTPVAPVAPIVPAPVVPVTPAPVAPAPVAPAASLTGAGPRLSNLPGWENRLPTVNATPPMTPAPPLPTTPGPGAGGLSRLDNAAMALPAMYTSGSTPIGTRSVSSSLPFEPSQTGYPAVPAPNDMAGDRRLMGPAATTSSMQVGGSSEPIYATRYADVNGNAATITGPNQRVGGGTLSAPDQGNGGTAAGNVAAIHSQIAALQSLREARNPGITTGLSAVGASPPSVDVFARPGDSFGDSQMRANQYQSLLQAAGDRSPTRGRGAREALIQSAQGLMAPGLAQLQQQSALAGQQAGLQAALAGHTQAAQAALAGHQLTAQTALAGQTLAHQQAQATLAQQKDLADRAYGLDTLKFADAQQKQGFDQAMQTFIQSPKVEQEKRLSELESTMTAAINKFGPNDPRTKQLILTHGLLVKARTLTPTEDWMTQLLKSTPPP